MDVHHLVYLLFKCWDYGGTYGRVSFGIPTVYVLGLRWHIWTCIIWYTYCLGVGITVAHMDVIIWYTYCLGVGITVEHMDVYHLVYLLFRCWDYGGAYGRISLGIPTV